MTKTLAFTFNQNVYNWQVHTYNSVQLQCLRDGKSDSTCHFFVTCNGDELLARFCLSVLPGCCGVVVSHDTARIGPKRNQQLSDGFRELKEAFAKDLGYSAMICTTDMSNIPALKNLFKSKYEVATTFRNSRTGNQIAIGVKKL